MSTDPRLQMAAIALEHWGASAEQQRALIGPGAELAERVEHILSIHSALRQLFPDRELAYRWPSTPNRSWEHRTPLSQMADGVAGMREVLAYLTAALGR